MDYSIISTVQELSYRRFFYFRHSGIVQKTDMSGSLTAGWSFPLGHKMCLQFIITQHKFVIVMENTFTLKMKMIM